MELSVLLCKEVDLENFKDYVTKDIRVTLWKIKRVQIIWIYQVANLRFLGNPKIRQSKP